MPDFMAAVASVANVAAAMRFEKPAQLPIRERGHAVSGGNDRKLRLPGRRAPEFLLDQIERDSARRRLGLLAAFAFDREAGQIIARR
jgi:hypothetical protein